MFFVIWLLVVLAITVPDAGWHLERIARTFPNLHLLFFILLAVLLLGALGYTKLRQRFLWRYEPAFLATLAVVICLWFEPFGTLACLVLAVGALLIGGELLMRNVLRTDTVLEEFALAFTMGFGVQALLLFLLGSVSLLAPLWLVVFFVAPLLFLRGPPPAFCPSEPSPPTHS